MKNLSLACVLCSLPSWVMAAGNLEDGPNANLWYDPSTGIVLLDARDTPSRNIISFVVGTDQSNLRHENFRPPFIDVGTNTDSTPFQIGQTDPLNQGVGSLIDLGNIFPAGIGNGEALSEYLTLAEYASDLGQGGSFDVSLEPALGGELASLSYDPTTGGVVIDATNVGDVVIEFRMTTSQNNLRLEIR